MRKIIVLSFITLDGVMQAPGGPEEDTVNGFKYGGWSAPYFDEAVDKIMEKQMKPADLLLGRITFEIFASYWPEHADNWPGINDVTKYVMSNTMNKSDWKSTVSTLPIQRANAGLQVVMRSCPADDMLCFRLTCAFGSEGRRRRIEKSSNQQSLAEACPEALRFRINAVLSLR